MCIVSASHIGTFKCGSGRDSRLWEGWNCGGWDAVDAEPQARNISRHHIGKDLPVHLPVASTPETGDYPTIYNP
jgi:hypothetical protein